MNSRSSVFDTVVIGGGLLGCFCALNLVRRSAGTLLLEKEKMCAPACPEPTRRLSIQGMTIIRVR